jgi:peptidoglycan hydrolase-like protein with peptidoglycan-binding domain
MSHKLTAILSRKVIIALVCLLLVGGFATVAFAYTQANSASASAVCPKTVAYGSVGADVNTLQSELRKHGYQLAVDGIFGPKTKAAVIGYQQSHGLEVDGIAGPQTWRSLGYCEPGKVRPV